MKPLLRRIRRRSLRRTHRCRWVRRPSSRHGRHRVRDAHRDGGRARDDDGSVVELAAVMIGVFALLVITLVLGMRWLATKAADAAAQRALEISQSTDGTEDDARQVARRLATSSRAVTDVRTDVHTDGTTVAVDVTVTSVLGSRITRTASGPVARFVEQEPSP